MSYFKYETCPVSTIGLHCLIVLLLIYFLLPVNLSAQVKPPVNGAFAQPDVILVSKQLRGKKRYELSNHLGNVLSVVTDRKLPQEGGGLVIQFKADIISMTDYYAFGMAAVEREMKRDRYRYGFNGGEVDNEIKGANNSIDLGVRIYDPRLGRWMTMDPLASDAPDWSPYRFGFDNPIRYADPEGRWEWDAVGNLVAEKGDNAWTLARYLGTNSGEAITMLNRGGYTVNDDGILDLKIDDVLSQDHLFIDQAVPAGPVVTNTRQATNHYFNGNGASADVGNVSTNELLDSDRFQEKHTKITSQVVEPEGFFSVNMTRSTFHIGRTNVDYRVTDNGNASSVTYTMFSRDGFWDPDFIDENTLGRIPYVRDWTNTRPDGPGPNLERFGGTPYHYRTRERKYFFKTPEPEPETTPAPSPTPAPASSGEPRA